MTLNVTSKNPIKMKTRGIVANPLANWTTPLKMKIAPTIKIRTIRESGNIIRCLEPWSCTIPYHLRLWEDNTKKKKKLNAKRWSLIIIAGDCYEQY
jgi:hypothetical protein